MRNKLYLFSLIAATNLAYALPYMNECISTIKDHEVHTADGRSGLKMENCQLNDRDIPAVVDYYNNMSSAQILNLNNNPNLTAKAYTLLSGIKQIRELYIENSNMDDDGATALSKLQPWYIFLKLDKNKIHDKGATALANTKAFWFDISNNEISDVGALYFGKYNKSNTVDLSFNNIGVAGAKGLAKNNEIKYLYIDHNNVSDGGIAAFRNNNTLGTLSARDNHINDAGAISLAKNSVLETILLDNNNISDEGAFAFAKTTNVNTLSVMNNNISDKGKTALKKNRAIRNLYL